MGIGASDKQPRCRLLVMSLVQAIEQMTFMVGLAEIDLQPQLMRQIVKATCNVIKRIGPVNLWLAHTKQVEVGAIEDVDEISVSQGVFPSIVLPKVVAGPYMWIAGKSEPKCPIQPPFR